MPKDLKNLLEHSDLIEKMSHAFADLNADYELSLESTKKRIDELKSLHVDINGCLSNLCVLSVKSNGIVKGLRGTGKTHLMLMARDEILHQIDQNKSFPFYINLKHLYIPEDCNQEKFNRFFSIFLFSEIYKQLKSYLQDIAPKGWIQKLMALFQGNEKHLKSKIEGLIPLLILWANLARIGNERFEQLSIGSFKKEEIKKNIQEMISSLNHVLSFTDFKLTQANSEKFLQENSKKLEENNSYESLLNVNCIRDNLLKIVEILQLSNIVFYFDEYEKLYHRKSIQQYLCTYLGHLMTSPIQVWLAYVPFRGSFFNLVLGGDFVHQIDLDEQLIYENSETDNKKCTHYFTQFINNRLKEYFPESNIDHKIMFAEEDKLKLLILASMGNTRDFGSMILNCWTNFKANQRISKDHTSYFKSFNLTVIKDSIITVGKKKAENISQNEGALKLLRNIENYCFDRKTSHFLIEKNEENESILDSDYFSELFYQKILHFRKSDLSDKEGTNKKYFLIALNFGYSFDYHSGNSKKIDFFIDPKDIRNKARRYIFVPKNIIEKIDLDLGKKIRCQSCQEMIDLVKMKIASEKNTCPYCMNALFLKKDNERGSL